MELEVELASNNPRLHPPPHNKVRGGRERETEGERATWAFRPVSLCQRVFSRTINGSTTSSSSSSSSSSSFCCLCQDIYLSMTDIVEDNNNPNSITKLPDHLLIEIFIRTPISEWVNVSCVTKHWAELFRGESLWQAALLKSFPLSAGRARKWPGPIPRGPTKRRFTALNISKHLFSLNGDVDEIVGHTYLFLKEKLEHSTNSLSSAVLHGTMIDQFIACGKSRDMAHELASQIWLAVLDNLEENKQTFLLLKQLAQEADVFLPYPYSRSIRVQWRVFEKLFTDFRDCFSRGDYYDVLSCAKNKFQPIPSAWLGY